MCQAAGEWHLVSIYKTFFLSLTLEQNKIECLSLCKRFFTNT
jgi:hypothetical protein